MSAEATTARPNPSSGDFRLELPVRWKGRQPELIGDFRVLSVLGSGGSGTVYLAEETDPVERRVAIKLLDERFRDTPAEARFRVECQALAQMNHAGIAHLYAAGRTQEGQYFLVMEYVDGPDILSYCDQHRLSLPARLELFCQVCEAVQHAHHRAFIHRDLKPSNILVRHNGDDHPQPKIIDFGIAKPVDQPISDTTRSQGVVGSPLYLSPESILASEDSALTPDTRVDIYGLGMVLYKLLVGALPLEILGSRLAALIQGILAGEHAAPSHFFATLPASRQHELAEMRGLTPETLTKRLHGDLDWIALRSIHLDRDQRYPSALALAEDVRRHLRCQAVLAGPPTLRYRMGKWLRRNRLAATAAVLACLLLLAAIAGILVENRRANAEAARARSEAATAAAVSNFLDDLLRQTDPARRHGDTIRSLLDIGAQQMKHQLQDLPEARGRLLLTMGQAYSQLQLIDEAEALLEEALELARQTYGSETPEEARALRALGALRFRQGREDQAERLLLRALEIQRQTLGDENAEVVETLSTLVELMGSGNRLSQAETYLQQALEIQEEHPEMHPRHHAINLMRLGSLRGAQGQVEEALDYLMRASDQLEKLHGPDHLLVSDALSSACQALGRLQRTQEAESVCRRSLEIRIAQLGSDHVKTSQSQFNLAAFYIDQQRYGDAEPLLRTALETRRVALSPHHPRTLAVLRALAYTLAAQTGSLAEAASLYEELVAAQDDVLPPQHPERLAAITESVDVLERLGRTERAQQLRQLLTEASVQGPAEAAPEGAP